MPSAVCLGPITITVRGILSRFSTWAAMRPEKVRPAWGSIAAGQASTVCSPSRKPSIMRLSWAPSAG